MNDNAVVGTPRRGTGATVIAALGGLLFGYDTGIISAALLYLGPAFGLSDQAKEIVVASLLVGAIVGVAGGGTVMDRIGRRRTLLGVAVLFLTGAVASGLAGSLTVLLLARIVLGLAIGAASVAVPAYIAEIAPAHLRGRLVSVNQLMISSGILLSYVTGYVLSDAQAWRWMLAIAAVPAAVMLVALPRLPESPRWLLAKGREDEARALLADGRSPAEVDDEVRGITEAMHAETRSTVRDLLGSRFRPGIVLGVGVAATNQLVGVNAVTYYTPTLLTGSGFGESAAILSSVGLGVANVAFTLVGLVLVDRIGRRPLVLGGTGLVVVALVVIGAVYAFTDLSGIWAAVLLAFLMIYQASFAASLGLAMWLVNSEVFPTEVRGKAGSAGLATHWILNLLISVTVLTTIDAITPSGLFWLYAVLGGLGLVFLYRRLPETRGRTLEEIDAELNGGRPARQAPTG
ncbi:major facilitator transporter [Pseudonocardia sp. EC080610-09]|uniref:sugar porter family MFS transporter n=1 Tax=unclassified Pseudonocardia TaxID=2619320 RepID=UPI0006CB2425|nr:MULTISPECIES: sugar porter family MFS transporter [unclassified Pseudonocardia]ALE72628.1 major facilitator transporter [Pseudonocardia sp. EC080625-04]ALL75941.1 major facilitator transporter [Pseudonocardia sp. EC080610-09]ALL82969.1 major facilitator transporter [Pseudonocardia sp. EC080619-01]